MNKFVKKIVAAGLAVVMTGGMLAACSANTNDAEKTTASKTSFKIGICQLVQHDALDKAAQGFEDTIKELGEENGITFELDYQNASGEPANCTTIANQFVSNNVDLVMAVATPALQACANATASTSIPVVATAITNFGTALDIDMGPTDATGINVTGTHDLAPLEKQAEQVTTLFPEAKKVGILYCSAEANSKFQSDGMQKILEEAGLEVNVFTFADSNDIQAVTKKAAEESDVLYIPTDNTVASNGAIVDAACQDAKTPIISGETSACLAYNGVATYSIDFYEIGQEAARMAYEILVEGADVKTMNIREPKKLTAEYIPAMAEKYGVLDIIEADGSFEVLEAE